jgi:aromatic-amino-acid transaminase
MRIIAEHATGKVLKRDALQIGNEAKLAKEKNPATVNATVGMFYHEDGCFRGFQTVRETIASFADDDYFSYSPSDGGCGYREAVLNWVFDGYRKEIEERMTCKVVATPGGTGAIYASIFNSLDLGQILLYPDLYWGPYAGIANNCGLKSEKFSFFSGKAFNLTGFIERAESIYQRQGKLVFILNDPCNNPTGYTLSDSEFENLLDYLNSKELPTVLIYDIAYLDMDYRERMQARKKFLLLTKAKSHILISVAFSASKTFAIYGQRLGAQIILGKDTANVLDCYNAANFTARNTWSNANKAMINLLVAMDREASLKECYLRELDQVRGILKQRAELFLREAKAVGLEHCPYEGGFFVTLPVKNNEAVLEALIAKEKIYLLPFSGSVRLALCSLPLAGLEGLAGRLARVISGME